MWKARLLDTRDKGGEHGSAVLRADSTAVGICMWIPFFCPVNEMLGIQFSCSPEDIKDERAEYVSENANSARQPIIDLYTHGLKLVIAANPYVLLRKEAKAKQM